MPDDEKGKFSADIGQDVIDAALKSVSKGTAPAAAEAPAPTDPPADPKDAELETLKAQLELSMAKGRETMEKLRDEHDKMLRATADLDNYKKRALKEKEEVQKFGLERLLKDFLPVIDNLDRALELATGDFDSLKKGVAMTRKLFEDTLGRHGVRPFNATGKLFDPRLHEAMQQVETAEIPPNQVVSELVRGYMLNDRLMRPALVAVAKAPAPTQPSQDPGVVAAGDPPTEPEPGSQGA